MAAGTRSWAYIREIVVKMNGPFCAFCKVPTAATIDHVQARTSGGEHDFFNLRIACPLCNSRKNDTPVDEFLASGRWKLEKPTDLPLSTREMLKREFGWNHPSGEVSTSSTNSKLLIREGVVYCMVRPHKDYEWIHVKIGPIDRRGVNGAAWDFLVRHGTPKAPKRKKISQQAMKKKYAQKKRG